MTKIVLFLNVIFSILWPEGWAEVVLGTETDEFDFDGLPGAQHEFKIEVGAGKEECFYQKIVAGGKLHISFEVLRGGDQYLDFTIKGVSGQVLQEARTRPRWITELDTNLYAEGRPMTEQEIDGVWQPPVYRGPYAICLDNTMSRMASKLVYVFLVTYVEEEWSKYRQEIEEVELTVSNFTVSIQNVHESVKDALVHQAQSRMHVIKDWYLITGNNSYIQTWSICQCVVVIMCSGIQVFFVRRLFRGTNVTPTAKPRA
ncbi:transmembrane emp24 domain-containing protein 5-like isoform X1 [Ruditapes philippinarum]|uniref:transmembrane emp24 domain-containing protein 5-like isoform X1 n=1 Tax=Ruditapes philippinarum TaxID=129788 RepID=UPI00295B94F6|nr:transmembrane emp24 domain-containing protein 5-like isoform X1 [Ruditapes philippinarum]